MNCSKPSSIEQALLGEMDIPILLELVPEIEPMINCQQNHPGHSWDVYTHTIKVIKLLPKDVTLRLAALLHDIGKPQCKVQAEDGFDHFWGHEEVSAQMAAVLLNRLNIDQARTELIVNLIRLHDTPIATSTDEMKAAIDKYGSDFINKLLNLQRADLLAHSSEYCDRKMAILEATKRLFHTVNESILIEPPATSVS